MNKKIKSPGFYTPMDIAPGEFNEQLKPIENYKPLEVSYSAMRRRILIELEKNWGPRCGIKDTEEYSELIGDKNSSRCPACVTYEKFDEFWERFDYENTNNP